MHAQLTKRIYLDNAATSFPKPDSVYDAVFKALRDAGGNPGRSAHMLSLQAAEAVFDVREKIAGLLNIDDPSRVVFTLNATYALNMAIKTTIRAPCHVLISDMEHNATFRPISHMAKKISSITYSTFSTDGNLYENIKRSIRPDTSLIVSTLTSNVTGKEVPIEVLSKIRGETGIPLIVDASQAIGHMSIDLKKTPVDILCAPGHKGLFGIMGCGFAVFCDNRLRDSFIEGGSGNFSADPEMPKNYPERFEAGTLPVPAIVSLGAGIREIMSIGVPSVESALRTLGQTAEDMLSDIKDVKIEAPHGGGILSFNYKGLPSSAVATYLDQCRICVRSGYHCAPLAHRKIGTMEQGTVRVSFSYLNSESDIRALADAMVHAKFTFGV